MNNKYLKGNLDKNIAFCLSWLLPIFAIILFVLDKETLTREEKTTLLTIFVCAVACIIPIAGIIAWVFMIIAAIKAFKNEDYKVPYAPILAEKLAEKFLK